MTGPTLPFSENLHAGKYRGEGEDFRDAVNRYCTAMTDDPDHYRKFREINLRMAFMPGGRVQSAQGASRRVASHNCFVSGTIGDSFIQGDNSIMAMATEAAATMRLGGGIGYDFSTLRPRKDLIASLMSQASGPVSFMEIFDALCRCIASAGHRRGAQMGMLRVDHPDIEEFVHIKNDLSKLTGFNISVAVTDEFMFAVQQGLSFDLRFNGKVYRTIDARALWEMIMRSTWDYGEPGVIFIDRINDMNNLYYCETIAATNPCGEQPLPPYGACLLGSFNATKYVVPKTSLTFQHRWEFDYDRFIHDIYPVVRAMDNVVDNALYPLPQQELEAKNKRRMGLGITGLANAGEACGFPYGSAAFLDFERKVLTTLRDKTYEASIELAAEKGSFPLYQEDLYLDGNFIKTLPEHLQHAIKKDGIRNSHLTSIAPTGTISFCADYISSAIEPVFGFEQPDGSLGYEGKRIVQTMDGPTEVDVSDYGWREFGVKGKLAQHVTAQEHVAVLSVAAELVDSSVSKTVNVDGSMAWEDFKAIYTTAFESGCKGCTTFNSDGKRMGILLGKEKATKEKTDDHVADDEPAQSCFIDFATGRRECG